MGIKLSRKKGNRGIIGTRAIKRRIWRIPPFSTKQEEQAQSQPERSIPYALTLKTLLESCTQNTSAELPQTKLLHHILDLVGIGNLF
jgi:hypothetical protein